MTASLFELVVDRPRLVFGNIIEYVQVVFLCLAQKFVKLVRNHLIRATLKWK